MSNPYFKFKQFVVQQDKCAMKVCTDACLFGAWVAGRFENMDVLNILDIGTGTALLSLMLAQKINAHVDAVEIDPQAASQAKENIQASHWHSRIDVISSPIESFDVRKNYDLIICNPPFYENDLLSPDIQKNMARHDESLNLDSLLRFIQRHLQNESKAAVMIPYQRTTYFEKLLAQHNLDISEKLLVRQTPAHDYFRSFILFSKTQRVMPAVSEITIRDARENYTNAFVELLKDYYLAF